MRAFITGITGFAGSHLAEHLLAEGDEVLGACRGPIREVQLPASLANVELVSWDISQPASAAARARVIAYAPHVVYHLAAMSIAAHCEARPAEAWATNVDGAARVLQLAAECAICPRLLFVSSAHVYGDMPHEAPVVAETAALRPVGIYARGKWAAEQLVRRSAEVGVETIIARAFNHAGPRQPPQLMISEWARALAWPSQEPLCVQSLEAYLDLADVRDVVRAYRLLALAGQPGEAYNVGSGVNRRSGNLLATLMKLAGDARPVRETAPGLRQRPVANLEKLAGAIAWRPEIALENTLADTLAYWRGGPRL